MMNDAQYETIKGWLFMIFLGITTIAVTLIAACIKMGLMDFS